MKIEKKEKLEVELSKVANCSVYVHTYAETVDFDFSDTDFHGVRHDVEINMPLALARTVADELAAGIASYDQKQAEKAAEVEAAEAEKAAEELGVEDVGA